MGAFYVGDLVRISPGRHLSKYTGRILALEEPQPPLPQYYRVEMRETGLVRTFAETDLELILKPKQQNAG
jgi:hypothetical protein